jgi:D-sedoheptulose 7-phosphate isomerase
MTQASTFFSTVCQLLAVTKTWMDQGVADDLDHAGERVVDLLLRAKAMNRKVLLVGNGGSAAIVSHLQNDLCKMSSLRAMCFHEIPLLTALANDESYEQAFPRGIELWAEPGDVVIAVSSSGRSQNILRSVTLARARGCTTVGISGFEPDNPLWKSADVGFYVPSMNYGEVEVSHQLICHWISDRLAQRCKGQEVEPPAPPLLNDGQSLRAVS